MTLNTVVLGTKNPGKIREIAKLFAPLGIPLLSLSDFAEIPDILEDGQSFRENAEKKATGYATALHRWVIAEDSGICVTVLKGAPGINSARFAGENATDVENNHKLMTEMQNIPSEERAAFYICHVCVSDPSGSIRLNLKALCRGYLTEEARGTNGFGYDPYFQIAEYHRTFGELPDVVKSHISHRAKAFEKLARLIPTIA